MAYDSTLAERIRAVTGPIRGVSERPMFGGLCFMLDGKMFCGIVGDELMARVGKEAHQRAVARPHARTMDFTGRPMEGYVFVAPPGFATAPALRRWVEECAAHVATLPAKTPRRRKRPLRAPSAAGRRGSARRRAARGSPRG